MKYTFEFKLGCVERYKQARMRPSARKQKQKFLQIPRPALGEAGKIGRGRTRKDNRAPLDALFAQPPCGYSFGRLLFAKPP